MLKNSFCLFFAHFLFFFIRERSFMKNDKSINKKENKFQSDLITELKETFQGSIVTKLDSSHIQGIPDLLILYKNKWGILECKRNKDSKHQPNQDYYVDKLNEMSFSRFVYPENKEEVINDLKKKFGVRGKTS